MSHFRAFNVLPVLIFFLFYAHHFIETFDYHGDTYQKETKTLKSQQLWNASVADKKSQAWPSELELAELFLESMTTSFDWVGDDMPYQFFFQKRPKLIHSVGVVAQSRLVITNNSRQYTGIFQSGSANAILRMSLAGQPSPPDSGITAGIAIKFLRSGQASGNIFAMYSLLGQPSWNFFAHDLTNHVPDLFSGAGEAFQLVRRLFSSASDYPVFIGLSDLARFDENGNESSKPKFPFRLVFHPRTNIHTKFPDQYPGYDFTYQLTNQLAPAILYDLYVQDEPDSPLYQFGYLESLTYPTTTLFGDATMFFEHTRMENDLIFRPDWKDKCQQIMKDQQSASSQYTYPDLPWS